MGDIKGVAGKVNLKQGLLTVSYAEDVADDVIKARIERAGIMSYDSFGPFQNTFSTRSRSWQSILRFGSSLSALTAGSLIDHFPA